MVNNQDTVKSVLQSGDEKKISEEIIYMLFGGKCSEKHD